MKKFFKSTLYKTLGQKNYLKLLHKGFYWLYDTGALKNDEAYQYNYFVKNLVHSGNYVLDLGANLGYFAKIFSRLAGNTGKVICIEPVKPFFETLKWGLSSADNVQLYNYALGTEYKTIEMVLPKTGGYIRTGLAHVPADTDELNNDNYTFNVEMVRGSELLKDLPRLDYIKCDIEGYEEYVLPELQEIIVKHKPMIQLETWDAHREKMFAFMSGLGYEIYGLVDKKLTKELDLQTYGSDFLFVHRCKEAYLKESLGTSKING